MILINNKIIYFSLELKKEKFINVLNHIIINFWILMMLIIWPFMLYVGILFIQKYSSVVQLIGRLKFGILIISNNENMFSMKSIFVFAFSLENHYLSMILVVLLVMLFGHLIHRLYLLHVQLMEKFIYLI